MGVLDLLLRFTLNQKYFRFLLLKLFNKKYLTQTQLAFSKFLPSSYEKKKKLLVFIFVQIFLKIPIINTIDPW